MRIGTAAGAAGQHDFRHKAVESGRSDYGCGQKPMRSICACRRRSVRRNGNIRDNVNAQGAFNSEIQEGSAHADGLMNSIKGMVAAYATIQTVQNVLNISDELTTTTARLDMMNDGVRSTDELVKMVYASATGCTW